jgi:hypothetical protein
MEFDFSMKHRTDGSAPLRDDTPFSILLLGDFGGPASDAAGAPMRKVDIDSVEELWEVFEPGLELEIDGVQFGFMPRDLDHFHPDHLYYELPVFKELRGLRKRLLDPATADATLADLMSTSAAAQVEEAPLAAAEEGADEKTSETGEDMFGRLLGGSRENQAPAPLAAAQSNLDLLIQQSVAPHIVHDPNPRVDAAVDSVDRGITDLMRKVLHHPEFQALESAWRSLFDLVQNVETDETLEIRVCNIGRTALLDALPGSAAELNNSNIWRLLVERFRVAADDRTPSVLAVNFYFGLFRDFRGRRRIAGGAWRHCWRHRRCRDRSRPARDHRV